MDKKDRAIQALKQGVKNLAHDLTDARFDTDWHEMSYDLAVENAKKWAEMVTETQAENDRLKRATKALKQGVRRMDKRLGNAIVAWHCGSMNKHCEIAAMQDENARLRARVGELEKNWTLAIRVSPSAGTRAAEETT